MVGSAFRWFEQLPTLRLVVANMFSVPLGIMFGADVNLTINHQHLISLTKLSFLPFFFSAHGRRIHQEVLFFVIMRLEIN